jgi:hypothetical protein
MDQYARFIPVGESSVGIPGHSFFIREARKQIKFEWEQGDAFVYIHTVGHPEPIAMARSDFRALHGDAAEVIRAMDAEQSAQIVKLTERGPMFLVERND